MALHKANGATEDNRESSYPIYSLEEALKVAKAVLDLGGTRSAVKKDMLAQHLKFAPTGPSFVQRLGAAKCFGLIQGRGEYYATDLATRYFFPISETDRATAALELLKMPKAFSIVISRFHGHKLPPNEVLANIMHLEAGVPASWKFRMVPVFIKSAKIIGMLDDNGNLKAAELDPTGKKNENTPSADATIKDKQQAPLLLLPEDSEGMLTHFLPLSNQRKVIVVAPTDITQSEIARLQKWVEVTLLVEWSPKDEPPTN